MRVEEIRLEAEYMTTEGLIILLIPVLILKMVIAEQQIRIITTLAINNSILGLRYLMSRLLTRSAQDLTMELGKKIFYEELTICRLIIAKILILIIIRMIAGEIAIGLIGRDQSIQCLVAITEIIRLTIRDIMIIILIIETLEEVGLLFWMESRFIMKPLELIRIDH